MYILFDIGATNMRIAASKDLRSPGKLVILPTPKRWSEGKMLFRETARYLADGKKVKAIAGGVAGVIDKKRGSLINRVNLRGWNRALIVRDLSKALAAPTYLENDASLAGLGEAHFGAGKGKHIVAYLTISTGVGGCRIVNGSIDANATGFDPGHQFIAMPLLSRGAKACPCGSRGHLEAYISGRTLEKQFHTKPRDIHNKRVWDNEAHYLAYGLNNIIILWSPDIIVLGGSMMKKVGIPIERVRYHLKKIFSVHNHIPPIKKAALGDLSGLRGAMVYLKNLNYHE